MYNTLEEHK